MDNGEDWTAIGNILLRRGSLTKRQLERALALQKAQRSRTLGDLLIELKLCDREEVLDALHEQEIHRIPPETHRATMAAQETLRLAFAKVELEAKRLEKRRSESVVLKISPEEL